MDERFGRNEEEAEEHRAYWRGFGDGMDKRQDGTDDLQARKVVKEQYIEGYADGFYERKQREKGPYARGLILAQGMYVPRRYRTLLSWSNYTREPRGSASNDLARARTVHRTFEPPSSHWGPGSAHR